MAFNLITRARSWILGFILFTLFGSILGPFRAQAPSIVGRTRPPAGLQGPGLRSIPQLVGHIPGEPSSLSVAGGYAALAYWRGFELLDVSHPAAPRGVAFLPLSHNPTDVVLDHDYAYLPYVDCGQGETPCINGLLVLDIADPTAPRLVSDFPTAEGMDVVAVKDGIVLGGRISLYLIDASKPEAPHAIAKFEDFCGWMENIQVYKQPGPLGRSLAFVTCQSEVVVADISNPEQPAVRGPIQDRGSCAMQRSIWTIQAGGTNPSFI